MGDFEPTEAAGRKATIIILLSSIASAARGLNYINVRIRGGRSGMVLLPILLGWTVRTARFRLPSLRTSPSYVRCWGP
eukprot:5231252-Pyramimonas_sp.AAC.1